MYVCVSSTLSQVLHAVAALLYPFSWQHTFISIVPTVLIDGVMAPTPYLLGVQKNLLDNIHDHSDVSVYLCVCCLLLVLNVCGNTCYVEAS